MDYLYDWEHRLARRTQTGGGSASVRHIYDEAWNVLCDFDGATGAVVRRYLHGSAVDEVLAEHGSSGGYFL